MKKILFAASECVPFIKTGGLADVVGSLPKYFNKEEYDVRVIMPKYLCIKESLRSQMKYVTHFYTDFYWRTQYVGVLEMEYEGVHFYFVDSEFYFGGPWPYGNMYEDIEKFCFFSKAVLSILPLIGFKPDIIHCHDWQTGLVPVYLRTTYGDDNFYAGMKTVYSIHNMKFQGRWRIQEVMDITGLPKQIFNANELESYGEANYLKGGIVYADAVSTVSPTYAKEITTVEGGEGLDGLMSARRDSLYGILNGIDYEEYNPKIATYIDTKFSRKDVITGKKKNKAALQKELGLPQREDTYLVGIVSRMTNQKGFDLIAYVMDELLSSMDIQLVVLGTGESQYENMFHHFQNKYPDKISSYIGYSEERAHKIYASADAFLMPSLFEPCGLSQMMSMRYGTIPIVREPGGLKDTVDAYNEYEKTGTGFSFKNYNAHEMLFIIRYAENVFTNNKAAWQNLVRRAMDENFSWDASARQNETLYDKMSDN